MFEVGQRYKIIDPLITAIPVAPGAVVEVVPNEEASFGVSFDEAAVRAVGDDPEIAPVWYISESWVEQGVVQRIEEAAAS